MGREIRMVPPNWNHPKREDGCCDGDLQPMFNETFAHAAAQWKSEFAKWEAGERPDYCSPDSKTLEFWEWESPPPDRSYYRPWEDGEATWFQVWETVSEGTPVTPPFATREELIDYLSAHGDFWDQRKGRRPWTRENAVSFVNAGYAPTMILSGNKIYEARDGLPPA